MKKTVFCNIPFKQHVDLVKYESNDLSLPVSGKAVRYPINAFLEKTLENGDEVKAILLIKDDGERYWKTHIAEFKEEIEKLCNSIGALVTFDEIVTPFSEEQAAHEDFLYKIVDSVEVGSHVFCDITYGPKDMPIIVFSALNFVEKFLKCDIENIIYGQAFFKGEKIYKSIICDVSSLYYLNSVTNIAECEDSENAKQLLKRMLSL